MIEYVQAKGQVELCEVGIIKNESLGAEDEGGVLRRYWGKWLKRSIEREACCQVDIVS